MRRKTVVFLAGLAGLAGGPALAADMLVYTEAVPAAGSPVYAAQSMVTGDVALAIGYFDFGRHSDGWFGTGSARVNIPIAGALNQEFEIAGLTEFEEDGYYAFGGFSHTYFKSQASAAGIVLGASSLDGDGAYTAGAEGAVFLPTTTFLGHISYTWGDGAVPDFWTINGEARWYWNPNTRISGSVTYSDWNNSWMLAAGGEHLINGTGLSLFTQAAYFDNDNGDGWELLGGARYSFGPVQSLQSHDWNVPFSAARIISY